MSSRTLFLVLCVVASCGGDASEDAPSPSGAELVRASDGASVVVLDEATRARIGVVSEPLEETEAPVELELYGRVIVDPENTFVVRAPVAGELRSRAWPAVGARVESGAELGSVVPRLSASERADLEARSSEARGEAESLAAELEATRRELARAEQLASDQSVSEREIEERRAQVRSAEARQRAAEERSRSMRSALAGDERAALAVRTERAGEVVLASARPGEALEAGAALLEIVDPSRPLIELQLPIGAPLAPRAARIARSAAPELSFAAEIAYRPTDATDGALGARLRLRVRDAASADLRPGEPVTVWLETGVAPALGAAIPRTAIVRAGGKTWIWIDRGAEGFARTEVALYATARGWIARRTELIGARAVTSGAQQLLSFELLGAQSVPEAED